MKKFLCAVIVSIALCSCNRQNNPADRTTLHRDQSDRELERIAEHARDTLPEFFRHLLRPAQDEGNFRVKYPVNADTGSGFGTEQLWLSDIRYRDGVYYGIVDNTPFYTASVKKGDTVTFNAEDITDWMYTSNGKIIGGYSIKYLLEQLPEHSTEQQRIMNMLPDLSDTEGPR